MQLKTTLSMIVLTVFITTAATFFSGLYFTNDSLKKTIEQDLRFAIVVAGSLVGTQMKLMKTEAATVAERLEAANSREELAAFMEEQFNRYPDISALSVFDRNGTIANYSVPPHDHAASESARDIEMVYSGATIISSPFYCSTRGEFVMNVYTPMSAGRILSASVPGLTFSNLLAKHRLWQTGDIFMLNDAGRFIGAANEEIVLAMNDYRAGSADISERDDGGLDGLIQKILSSPSGVERYRFNGVERLCAYNRLEDSLMGWRVAVSVPLAESPQAEALKGQTYTAVFVLMIGVAAAFFLAKLASQPFKRIEAQNGDLEKLNKTIQAQAASLLEEHGRIKLMLDATPLASRLWNRKFELIECNEAAVQLFQLKDKQEYIDRYFELSPNYQPDGQKTSDKIKVMISDAFENGRCTYEMMYRMLDGTPVPAEITLVRVPYEDDYAVAAYSRDLREQKEMISKIEQRDRLLHTTNQVASILLRAEPEGFEGAMHTCMGMLAKEVNVDRINVFENGADGEKLFCTRIETWSKNAEARKPKMPGQRIYYDEALPGWLDLLPGGICVNKTVQNMSQAERKLIAPLGVLSMLVMPAFLQDTFWGFVSFDDCRNMRTFTENEISALRSASLQIFNALIRNRMLRNLSAATVQLETALQEAKDANRAKSDFLANMSHEMRTPLNAVIGLSEITLENEGLDGDAQLNLEKIHNSGSTLLSIVNDILDISKIQAGKFTILESRYDVPSLINDAILQNVLRIGSKPVQFVLDIDEDMPAYLYGGELRVKQIINNLLSNAFKYTEKGTVKLGLACERDGDTTWMTIRVSDTGCGIRPEDLKRLFTDYMQFGSTSNQQAGGTGLGLAITKSLTEMMDGTISVESEFGEGSAFTVRFRQRYAGDAVIGPGVAESLKRFQYSANELKRSTQLKRIRLPHVRVLVVDDNITNLDVVKGLMKPYGMQIDCVTGGREAIRAIREEKRKYDAVFMDHMMPEIDGIEATRIIREEIGTEYAQTVPIIALTANAIAGSEKMFLDNGFQGFISKPIDLVQLDEVIRHFLRDRERDVPLEEKPQTETAPPGEDGERGIGSDLLAFGQNIDGFDIRQGLEHYGDEATFIQILRSYAVNTKPLLESVGQPSEDALPAYAITVHGLKSASRSVYAEQAAALAEALEHAAEAGDFDFIVQNNPAFIKTARKLVENIETVLGHVADVHPKPQREKPDSRDLQKLCAACEDFDFTEIDAIMEEIEKYEYTSDDGLTLWLRETIAQMDWNRVAEKLASLGKGDADRSSIPN